jgi:hypothetical protein
MQINKTTYLTFVLVLIVMVLSITVFRSEKGSATGQQNVRSAKEVYQDRTDRYPVAEYDEAEPTDPQKRTKLRKQKQRYDKDAPFISQPGPEDEEIAFLPEFQFDFPALPIAKSDVIVIGQVLEAHAHRSHNKRNIFSNFQVRAVEVLKGNLTGGSLVTVQRVGGFVKFPNGQKVLFRLLGNGMPAVGATYVFFLNAVDEDYSILTAYELGAEGVVPLDSSGQFEVYKGHDKTSFLKTLRDAVSKASLQKE